MKKYYDVLGISEGATLDEIKKAYRKRIKETHPDNNLENPNASALFNQVQEAYDKLNAYLSGNTKKTTTYTSTSTNVNEDTQKDVKDVFDTVLKNNMQKIKIYKNQQRGSVLKSEEKKFDIFGADKKRRDIRVEELHNYFNGIIQEIHIAKDILGDSFELKELFLFIDRPIKQLKHFTDEEKTSLDRIVKFSIGEAYNAFESCLKYVDKFGKEIINCEENILVVVVPSTTKFEDVVKMSTEMDFDKIDNYSSLVVGHALKVMGIDVSVSNSTNMVLIDLKSVVKQRQPKSKRVYN